MKENKLKEPQFYDYIDFANKEGLKSWGMITNYRWHNDPRSVLFLLSRYKFVAKLLRGKNLLEVGCGDAFGTRLLLQEGSKVCAIDYEKAFVDDVNNRMDEKWKFECLLHDIISGPMSKKFDAAYSLDVFEHIPKDKEHLFRGNITKSIHENGTFVVGTPSINSQVYASEPSKKGHVNCKGEKELNDLMSQYFKNVFILSMNDEVVHTGFFPMANYFLGIGVGVKT